MTVHSWSWLGVSPGKHQLCLMLHYTPSFRLVSVWPWNPSPPPAHKSRTLPHCDLHRDQHILSAINCMPSFPFFLLFLIISVGLLEGACIILPALCFLYSSPQQSCLVSSENTEDALLSQRSSLLYACLGIRRTMAPLNSLKRLKIHQNFNQKWRCVSE